MKRLIAFAIAAGLCGLGSAASADTLLDLTNSASQSDTPFSLYFEATSAFTTISVAGYQVPDHEYVSANQVIQTGSIGNLLSQVWDYTPAPLRAGAAQYDGGSSVNDLVFAGIYVGLYDVFSQTFATTVGSEYSYNFLYSNGGNNEPSSLTVSENVAATSAAPEPSAWALMIVGVAVAGGMLRRSPSRRWSVSAT